MSDVSLEYHGGRTFAVCYRGIKFYMEPGKEAAEAVDADLLTSGGICSSDAVAIRSILTVSPKAKVVLPKAVAEKANTLGIDYHRMTTTDAALRVEYFKNGEYGRVYGVPAARRDAQGPQLDWTPIGGFPQIGFMARFGGTTIWHSGLGVPYVDLADRLRPYSVNVAIVTIGDETFNEVEAADLAEAIEATWLIPAPQSPGAADRFLEHMLGHRPAQRFKVFQRAETWNVPE
jgi:hypothetical protein